MEAFSSWKIAGLHYAAVSKPLQTLQNDLEFKRDDIYTIVKHLSCVFFSASPSL